LLLNIFREIEIDLPPKTQKNGTLSSYIILSPKKNTQGSLTISKHLSGYMVYKELILSKYKLNRTSKYVNLIESTFTDKNVQLINSNNETEKINLTDPKAKIITHLLTKIYIETMETDINFDRMQVPGELYSDIRLTPNNEYLPILHISKLSLKDDLYAVNYKQLKEIFNSFNNRPFFY
jgi:hypothetical protein